MNPIRTLDEVEREAILAALVFHHGNRTRAARDLGVTVRTIRNKLDRYRLLGHQIPEPKPGPGVDEAYLRLYCVGESGDSHE